MNTLEKIKASYQVLSSIMTDADAGISIVSVNEVEKIRDALVSAEREITGLSIDIRFLKAASSWEL